MSRHTWFLIVFLAACFPAFGGTPSETAQYPNAAISTIDDVAGGGTIEKEWGNRIKNEIVAIATALGVDPAGASTDVVSRIAGLTEGYINSIAIGSSTPSTAAFTTLSAAGAVTIDDNSGDAPTITIKDESNETVTISKMDGNYLNITTQAADGIRLYTGNFIIGNATPATTLNGEDLFVEGASEFDGAMRLDGALTTNSTITAAGAVTLDNNSGDAPVLTFQDNSNQTVVFRKMDNNYMNITTEATDGLRILTGNWRVGDGTPTLTMNGEDAYVEGTFEVDGAATLGGALTLDDGAGDAPTITIQDESDETAVLSKADGSYLKLTTAAADGLMLLAGNFWIGNGTPNSTINGEDLYVEGISEFDGAMRVDGALSTNSTVTAAGAVTLDDGAGDAPDLVFTDETNESATFHKMDADYLTITTAAGDGVGIRTGNFRIGDGTPTQTINGEDLYCEGVSEFDGAHYVDGAATFASTVTIDDNVGDTPDITMRDGTNETVVFHKADADYLFITTAASDGLNLLTGSFRIGNGTPDTTVNGEDLYVEGTSEFDGAMNIDGAVDFASTLNIDGTVTLDDDAGDAPDLVFTDATNQSVTFHKMDTDYCNITTEATDGLRVLVGNFRIGDGSPNNTLNGEDFYCEGVSEFDGAMNIDGAVDFASTLNIDGTVTLDDDAGDAPDFVFTDETNESVTFHKMDADYLTITTVAGDGVGIRTGNFRVGDGTPNVTLNGEDAYIEGTLEVDGNATLATLTIGADSVVKYIYEATPGAAAFDITATGVDADDEVVATLNKNSGAEYIIKAVPGAGVVNVTLSGDPGEEIKITLIAYED